MVPAGQVQQGGQGDAPIEEQEAGVGRGHVLGGVVVPAADPPGDEQSFGFDRLEEGQGNAGLGGQLLDGEHVAGTGWRPCRVSGPGSGGRALADIRRRRGRGRGADPGELAQQGLVGGIELAGHQPGDGGQGEAPLLEAADAGQAVEVAVVVPGHPALSPRRVEQALALVVADRVHRHGRPG